MKKPVSVSNMAMRDIVKYNKENNVKIVTGGHKNIEVWEVTQRHLMTKEQRRLNEELGITNINKMK